MHEHKFLWLIHEDDLQLCGIWVWTLDLLAEIICRIYMGEIR